MKSNMAVCVILLFCLVQVWGEERIVSTTSGPVRGYKEKGDIFTFYGIPYATAPTGAYRYQAPLPAPVWFEPLDAVDRSIVCPQSALDNFPTPKKQVMEENCLIANVYAPQTEEKNLPVVVYVHGGAYQMGHGNMFAPKNIVRSKKLVAVTFNYRLGIHGFLCLGTAGAPGNAGMKDQVALLRWVKKNIANFGGNPEDVTIAGYSAGSSAVDLLMLSPSTRGLFNKVIPESGANLSPWSIQHDPIENARIFAKSVGFDDNNDVYALEEFYTSASYDLLISTGGFWNRTDFMFLFSPCVERPTGEEPFYTNSPYHILKSGNYEKLPMLYGFADMEGLLRVAEFDAWKDKMNENFADFLPVDLKFDTEEEKNEVINKIKEFYFGGKALTQKSILPYINYMSDLYFAYPTLRSTRLQVEAGNNEIYLYEYNFVDDSTPPVPYTDNVKGANHCGQTFVVLDSEDLLEFMPPELRPTLTDEIKRTQAFTRELWINFITTGKPVPSGSSLVAWPVAAKNGAPHMSIGQELELRGALLEQRARFWDSIYERHYRVPQPPPTPTRHIRTEL